MASEKFLHLASCEAAADMIEETLRRLGRSETIVGMRDVFNEGPLHDIDAGGASRIEWWTSIRGDAVVKVVDFAGGAANTLLARMFERELGGRVIARNTNLTLADKAGKSVAAVRDCIRRWHAEGRPSVQDAHALASSAARAELSKFEPCLPNEQLAELQMSRLFDVEGARRSVTGASGANK